VSQKKGLQLLALLAQIVARRGLARPREIAHRLVHGVENPYPSHLPGPQQASQK
jgi:hypothetical protein